ncbi:RIB43A-like with coiled-coils protein 2 [Episyrphus balteatus]|uniref:RIB43A-like with coiled-coils protein 2 n=1 Tax=Episyrphus balteatus TaxID=286459 RepID=UPI002484F5A9|nr:RIB43A-like with coiled-coils protein 2 [Episyrphus balteatus]
MLKFVITTKEDLREAAKLENRRKYEEERKKRIFNGKQRLFGLDSAALEQQIAEKVKRQDVEAERERKYVEETERRDNILRAMEINQQREAKIQNSDLNYFRCRFQRKDLAREYDLNNPDRIKNSEPARISDDDPRLGISSAQIFVGEDLNVADRQRAQKNQQRAWLEQQMRERKQAEEDRKRADKILQESLNARDRRLMEMSVAERETQLKIKESIRRYNEMLAYEKKANKKLTKQQTQEDNLAEIYNMLGSDMLTENPDVAQSKVALNKKIAYMYKGMTPEEAEQFRAQQQRQLEQNKQRKDEEKIREAIWDQHALNTSRELILKERELKKIEKAQIEKQFEVNKNLAQEQKARKAFMNNVVYRNQATEEYWGQFNRTTR